jgi:hypothetical protein
MNYPALTSTALGVLGAAVGLALEPARRGGDLVAQGGPGVGLIREVAVIDRFAEQLRSAFPAGAIARVQVLEYGDDPEVELEKTAFRVFFDWPGRTEGKKADPKTVHAFVNANGAAITKLGDELPSFIGWVELRPDGLSGTSRDDGLAFRIGGRRGLA